MTYFESFSRVIVKLNENRLNRFLIKAVFRTLNQFTFCTSLKTESKMSLLKGASVYYTV